MISTAQEPVIELKCWSDSFQAMKAGSKRFDFRKNDRPYKIGATLFQREWNPDTGYTGDVLYHEVTFLIEGGIFGIPEGYCIVSVSEPRIAKTTADKINAEIAHLTMRIERDQEEVLALASPVLVTTVMVRNCGNLIGWRDALIWVEGGCKGNPHEGDGYE